MCIVHGIKIFRLKHLSLEARLVSWKSWSKKLLVPVQLPLEAYELGKPVDPSGKSEEGFSVIKRRKVDFPIYSKKWTRKKSPVSPGLVRVIPTLLQTALTKKSHPEREQ